MQLHPFFKTYTDEFLDHLPIGGAAVGQQFWGGMKCDLFLKNWGKRCAFFPGNSNHNQSHQQLSSMSQPHTSVPAYPALLFSLLVLLILYLDIVFVLLLEGSCLGWLKLHKTGHSPLGVVEHGSPGHAPPVLPCPIPSASQTK